MSLKDKQYHEAHKNDPAYVERRRLASKRFREKRLAGHKLYREKHREEIKCKEKEFRDANKNNPEYRKKRAAYSRKFFKNHHEDRLADHRAYYKKNKHKVNAQTAAYRSTGRGKALSIKNHRKYHLSSRYGITPEQFEQMRIAQGSRCAICNDSFKHVEIKTGNKFTCTIDHDHATGKLRQLLCDRCNKVLGFVSENSMLLKNMIDYLGKWK